MGRIIVYIIVYISFFSCFLSQAIAGTILITLLSLLSTSIHNVFNQSKLINLLSFLKKGACQVPEITQVLREHTWVDGNGTHFAVWDANITAKSVGIASLILDVSSPDGTFIQTLWELDHFHSSGVFD